MKILLITITSVLCICFSVQLYLNQKEWASQQIPTSGFAVDFGQDYPVGLYHVLAFFLLLSIILVKKFVPTMFFALGYAGIHFLATFWRIRTGLYGGDMCLSGGLCYAAIRRATWFDWTATGLILAILCLTILAIVAQARQPRFAA